MAKKNLSLVDMSQNSVESIDPSELAYHQTVLGQLQAAQLVAQQWGQYLVQRYKLGQKDSIGTDGVIFRAPEHEAAN